MLISYYNFHFTNCNEVSVNVSGSVNGNITGRSINIFDNNFNLVFTKAVGCLLRLRNIKKLTC